MSPTNAELWEMLDTDAETFTLPRAAVKELCELRAEVISLKELEASMIDRVEVARMERDYAVNIAVAEVQSVIGNLRGRIVRMLTIAGKYAHPGVNLGAHALACVIIRAGKED